MKKYLFFLLISLLFLPLAVAQPPHSNTNVIVTFDAGLVIANSPQVYLKQSEPLIVNFFVYNKTSGALIDNSTTSCDLYVDNSKGELVYFDVVDYLPEEYWGETLNASIFSEVGQYQYGIKCAGNEIGGSTVGYWVVTENGKPSPSGIVIVIFTLIFIALMIFGIVHFLKCLARVIEFDMDIIDTAYLMSTYFAVWVFYAFAYEYLGNQLVNDLLNMFITVGAFTHVFLALVGFMVSYIMQTLKFKQKQKVTY